MPLIVGKRNVRVFTGVSTNTNGQTIGQLQLPDNALPIPNLVNMRLEDGPPIKTLIPIPR